MIDEKNFREINEKTVKAYIDAHYGKLFNNSSNKEINLGFIVPRDVYDIRPETLDIYEDGDNTQISSEALKIEKEFFEDLKKLPENLNKDKIKKAFEIMKKYHSRQTRKSGEPYYIHPICVAQIAIKSLLNRNEKENENINFLKKNLEKVICVALLHDTLEDTSLHPFDINAEFGLEVVNAVIEVTKIDYQSRQRMITNNESFSDLVKKSPIAICVKLADRLHNLMTIDGHPSEAKRKAIAQETLEFFIAPAKFLGLNDIGEKLEEISNRILKYGYFKIL